MVTLRGHRTVCLAFGAPMKQDSTGSTRLLQAVDIRAATVDDLSAARKLLAAAFRAFASADCSEEEAAAMSAMLSSSQIIDTLRGQALYMAWLEQAPVAMAGWQMADNNGKAARLSVVGVDPMFGWMMVGHVERCAAKAGYRDMVVQATAGTEGFYVRLGFETTAHSVRSLAIATGATPTNVRVSYLRKPLPRPTRAPSVATISHAPAHALGRSQPQADAQSTGSGVEPRKSGASAPRAASGGHILLAAPVLSKASH